ncbi:FGGY-family carbohydrate kinase [Lichenihabitans psoromatis]|uniref:FGGY-family carbohydrate kinase n=1 Tax=Lichenihabitans psoromatis TaxID=2528642 RepID=UPI001035D573|nr:FGGY-family carbohydrate kinase [Lichenihabitans psoromatis]
MPDRRFVAVLDIGKTNVKVLLHDLATGTDLAVRTTPNVVRQNGPYPHFDIVAMQSFFLDGLADLVREGAEPIDAISITAHGGSGVLLGETGLALPVLDYEYRGVDATRADYDRIRPPFSETFSPSLPGGLNAGAQFFWQQQTFPDAFDRARWIMMYPQYWAWWLTGVAANEATSLGSHTDLWNPQARNFSSLVERAGWSGRMAPLRSAFDILGDLRPEIASRLGIDRSIPVACGIHDSNASLLPHIIGDAGPVSVVSTGTWVIVFATGGSMAHLDAARDTLVNVDAFGRPVPSARFMGGREFEILAGKQPASSDRVALAEVLERGIMVLPTFAPGNGPFPHGVGRWTHAADGLSAAERTVAASLYAGLMTATCLDLLQATGPTIVEGPFARNILYLDVLQAMTSRSVTGSHSTTGTSGGAALLVLKDRSQSHEGAAFPSPSSVFESEPLGSSFKAYAARWMTVARAEG